MVHILKRLLRVSTNIDKSATDFPWRFLCAEQLNFLKDKIATDKKLLLVEHKPLLLGEFGEKLLDR